MWRGSYGNPKAHNYAIRGVATDALNKIVITSGSEGDIKFWLFKAKGNNCLVNTLYSLNFISHGKKTSEKEEKASQEFGESVKNAYRDNKKRLFGIIKNMRKKKVKMMMYIIVLCIHHM